MSLFAPTLRSLMTKKNITEEELAEALGISDTMLYSLLSAYVEPSNELLKEITVFFGLPTSYLLGSPESATISEPKYIGNATRLVPVIPASKASTGLIKESDIINTVNLSVSNDFAKSEYLGIRIERDAVIGRRPIFAGDTVIINLTNQLSNDDNVAFSKRGKPVEFMRYTRSGPVITLYSYEDKEPVSFNVGDTEYKILGNVKTVEIVP